MPKEDLIRVFNKYEPGVLMECFYDMSQSDAARIIGVNSSSLAAFTKKLQMGVWPFMALKQGKHPSNTWGGIVRHREWVMQSANPSVRDILNKAAKRGWLNRTIFDPDMARQRNDPKLLELRQVAKTRGVLMPPPVSQSTPPVEQAVSRFDKGHAPLVEQVVSQYDTEKAGLYQATTSGKADELFDNMDYLQNSCLAHIEEQPEELSGVGMEEWGLLYVFSEAAHQSC